MMITEFVQWVEHGHSYVIGLAGIIGSLGVIFAVLMKIWHKVNEPNTKLQDRVEKIEKRLDEHDEYFKNDKSSINMLIRGQNRQDESLGNITEAVFLIIQHEVTGDHVEDMEKWMINQAKGNIASNGGENA